MNLGTLRARFRTRVDDRAEPFLWDDDEAAGFLNEAVNDVAVRTLCFRDETTPSLCQVTISANQTRYLLDPRVIEVIHAQIDDRRCDLERSLTGLFRGYRSPGVPQEYSVELEGPRRVLVLDRPPQVTPPLTTINLVVYRTALNPMFDDGDVCELPEEWCVPMLHGAAMLAWSTPNSDVNLASSSKLRDDAEARFNAYFGPRPNATTIRKRLRHRGPISGAGGPLSWRARLLLNRYNPSPNDPE
jgi:hypothetical protein